MKHLKLKTVSMCCTALFVFTVTMGFSSTEAEASGVVKKISATGCYNQETGILSGFSNNCILGEGECIDNGCPSGHAEGGLPDVDPE